jgi:hypothetical protein
VDQAGGMTLTPTDQSSGSFGSGSLGLALVFLWLTNSVLREPVKNSISITYTTCLDEGEKREKSERLTLKAGQVKVGEVRIGIRIGKSKFKAIEVIRRCSSMTFSYREGREFNSM